MKNSVRAAIAAVLWAVLAAQADTGDERILAARDAARSGDRARLAAYAAPAGHVLDPYPEYWWLSAQVARARWSSTCWLSFGTKMQGTP